jgi:hypothetical protein
MLFPLAQEVTGLSGLALQAWGAAFEPCLCNEPGCIGYRVRMTKVMHITIATGATFFNPEAKKVEAGAAVPAPPVLTQQQEDDLAATLARVLPCPAGTIAAAAETEPAPAEPTDDAPVIVPTPPER